MEQQSRSAPGVQRAVLAHAPAQAGLSVEEFELKSQARRGRSRLNEHPSTASERRAFQHATHSTAPVHQCWVTPSRDLARTVCRIDIDDRERAVAVHLHDASRW